MRASHSLFMIVFLGLFLGLSACKDACEDIACQNGGVCVEGFCECPAGYAGVRCEILLDPCFAITCQNEGTCISGPSGNAVCQCVTGWEGDFCETPWNLKYFGNYDATDVCNGGGIQFPVFLEQGTKFNSVTINNFNNRNVKVVADLIATTVMEVKFQPFTFGAVEGTGYYDLSTGNISLNYSIVAGSDTTLCSTLLEPI